MILGCLHITTMRKHTSLAPATPKREDRLFRDLRKAITKLKVKEACKNEWILEDTCRLVGMRISMR